VTLATVDQTALAHAAIFICGVVLLWIVLDRYSPGGKRFLEFILANLKSILLVVAGAGLFGIYLNDWIVALREPAPSPVHLDQWAAEYHGQHWITLSGISRPELSRELAGNVYVPVVATDYHQGDAIHAAIIPASLPAEPGPMTVEGYDASKNLATCLAGLPVDPAAICLRVGSKPERAFPMVPAALASVLALIGGNNLRIARRDEKRARAAEM
jgi:hypothetical protein